MTSTAEYESMAPMTGLEGANLALRFLLEMITLVALAFWAFTLEVELPIQIVVAIIAPLLAALTWGAFVAPKARVPLEDPARLGVELVFFGAGAVALMLAGLTVLAVAFIIAVVVHVSLMLGLKQR